MVAAVAACMIMAVTGCNAGAGEGALRGGAATGDHDRLVLGVTGEPANLDFTTTSGSAIPQVLMNNVYQGLVTSDQDGKVVPQLAESWETSMGGKVYDFILKKDVTFSNGGEFTAEDVKFSLERIKDNWTTDGGRMDPLDHVEVIDDHHVRVVLKRASNQWLLDMTGTVGQMFDGDGADDLANTTVGTGPYEVTKRIPGDRVTMRLRDDYWGEKPQIKTATFRYFADAVASTNALRSGDVDVLINMQAPDLIPRFEQDPGFNVVQGTSTGEVLLPLNNEEPPFDEPKVRQAINYAVDRQEIVDTAWGGYGQPIGAFVPPTEPYYEDLTGFYPHDPAKAKELLDEAGYDNLSFEMKVPTRPYATSVAEVVQSQLKEVGIDMKITSAEFPAVWLDTVFSKADYQASVILTPEAHDFLITFNNPDYYTRYDNSRTAQQVKDADAASPEAYATGMQNVVRTVTEDAAAVPLFLMPNITIAAKGINGINMNAVSESFDITNIFWDEKG
ncbi:MAG: ABC transporter substrate-binding protein [Galactobacter sp.]